ncbi:Major Facilitator Superfamily [Proteiniphilum saccharofermentans]|uniref:Major Facilitator Superfamily n=1 Tax=Proteiniphilum saccharofermentans TaxID=1642647 RepID=A0A1R3SX23_9BACT|nr:MFS transporter [Proteiniphilum saccharofermentans]SCD20823.1 Major Facilitator Superfamily [Proteiniphilum saccharofermentans]
MGYNKTLVYIAACIGMAFFGVAFIVMGAVLPSLTATYSLDAVGSSSLVSLLPVGVLAGSLLFGVIVDRYGYKLLLVVSTLFTLSGIEGLSFFENLNILRICIFLIGLGGGMLNGSTNALASDISNDRERGSRLSILGVCYGIGALGVPLLLGMLSKTYNYQFILQCTGLVMLLSVLYFIAIKFPEPKIKQGFPFKQAIRLIKEPLLLIMGFFLFFQSGIEGLTNNWTTSYLDGRTAIGSDEAVLCLTFFVLGMTVSRLILSYLLRILKHEYILLGGIMTAIIGIIILDYAYNLQLAAISLFIAGFGLAAGFPVIISYIGTAYKNISGTAIGLAMFIALTGNTLLNFTMGFISETFGISSFPVFIIILLLIQGIILLTNSKSIKNIY